MVSTSTDRPRDPYKEDARWIETIRRAERRPGKERVATGTRSTEKEVAYGYLLRKHWQGVTVLALQRVGDLREAEDVAQESFERAFRSLENLKEPTAFLGWLLRIASNVATDHIRSRKPVVSLDALGDAAPPEGARSGSSAPDFERRIERQDEVRAVLDALESLPENYREVITLKYLKEMDGRTMARQLGEPEGTVRNRLFRALEKLRGVLSARGERRARETTIRKQRPPLVGSSPQPDGAEARN